MYEIILSCIPWGLYGEILTLPVVDGFAGFIIKMELRYISMRYRKLGGMQRFIGGDNTLNTPQESIPERLFQLSSF